MGEGWQKKIGQHNLQPEGADFRQQVGGGEAEERKQSEVFTFRLQGAIPISTGGLRIYLL